MDPSFHHQEVFPLIARLIGQSAAQLGGYASHEQIVAALLADEEGLAAVTAARQKAKWATNQEAASNMVAWFSQQITVGDSEWVDAFDRKRLGGTWAYRPAVPTQQWQVVDASAVEGELRLFFHLRRERDPALRKAKKEAVLASGSPLCCESCGLVTAQAFPGLSEDILEVHHRVALSTNDGAVHTCLEDLALLCPNCHRAIHRTKPMLSVEVFRVQFLQQVHSDEA